VPKACVRSGQVHAGCYGGCMGPGVGWGGGVVPWPWKKGISGPAESWLLHADTCPDAARRELFNGTFGTPIRPGLPPRRLVQRWRPWGWSCKHGHQARLTPPRHQGMPAGVVSLSNPSCAHCLWQLWSGACRGSLTPPRHQCMPAGVVSPSTPSCAHCLWQLWSGACRGSLTPPRHQCIPAGVVSHSIPSCA
jgi:hypothetical protein